MRTILFTILIPIIINYLIIAFIIAEYNTNLWSAGERLTLVLMSIFSIIMTYTYPDKKQ